MLLELHSYLAMSVKQSTNQITWIGKDGSMLLPPSAERKFKKPTKPEDERNRINKAVYVDRLSILLETLKAAAPNSELKIIEGEKPQAPSVRKAAYRRVEISNSDISFLVCNQTAQALYIVRGKIPKKEFSQLSKEELEQKYPNEVSKVYWRNQKQWQTEIRKALDPEKRPKLDLKNKEAFREFIKSQISSLEWSQLSGKAAKRLRLDNRDLVEIARKVFGMKNFDIQNSEHRFKLAENIYGKSDPNIHFAKQREKILSSEKNNRDEMIKFLRNHFKSFEMMSSSWISERRKTKFRGEFGCKQMGRTILETRFNPDNPDQWQRLCRAVFPEFNPPSKLSPGQKLDLLKHKGQEYIIEQLKKQYPNSADLLDTVIRDLSKTTIDGVGITAIAGLLEIKNFDHYSIKSYINLAKELYGKEDAYVKEFSSIYEKLKAPHLIVEELAKRIPPKAWIDMSHAEIEDYRIADKSLTSLYNLVLNKSNHRISMQDWKEFGDKVHGKKQLEELRHKQINELRNLFIRKIKKKYPSAEDFADISPRMLRRTNVRLVDGYSNPKVLSLICGRDLGDKLDHETLAKIKEDIY